MPTGLFMTTAIRGAEDRLVVLNEQMGVWRCRTAFELHGGVPRDIHVTQAIAEVKQALTTGRIE